MRAATLITLAILFLTTMTMAQSTSVTLQVTDTDGQSWNLGSWSVTLVSKPGFNPGPPFNLIPGPGSVPNQSQSGGLSGSGGASMTLTPNASIAPAGSIWRFVVCPLATTDCYRQSVSIAGASQTVTLNPPAIRITGTFVTPGTLAYADAEIVAPATGAQYFNITSLAQRQWNGSTWSNMGGSGGNPALPSGSIQYNNAGAFGSISSVAIGSAIVSNGTGAPPIYQSKPIIDVRDYGAVPDGSTDNATAIAAAFTAANAVTTGYPTVYFGCNSASATCEYNYSGAGTSAINPTVPMTIACAPNAWINYTGSAHAADIGPSGLGQADNRVYQIRDCTFTGGASYTEGIFLNNFIVEFKLINNVFLNFGNQTGATVNGTGNNWFVLAEGNTWINRDNTHRNIMDFHLATNAFVFATGNHWFCLTAAGGACNITTGAYGLWARDGYLANNQLGPGVFPLVRISSEAGGGGSGMFLVNNILEGNTSVPTAAIEFGDAGATGNVHLSNLHLIGNSIFWPSVANMATVVTPQTPASGGYFLDSSDIRGNFIGPAPSGTGKWFNFNGGINNIFSGNHGAGSTVDLDFSVAALADSNKSQEHTIPYRQNNQAAGPQVNYPIAMDASGPHYLSTATYHGMGLPFACNDSSGSGTTQVCSTNPQFNSAGTQVQPVAGDCIIYSTTTTNTGALTLNVNAVGAKGVQKRQGTVALAAGDLVAGHNTWLCYDGTNWDLLDPITQ